MLKELKEKLELYLKWIPIYQLIIALFSLCFIIAIPLYFLPNLNQQFTHQNTVNFLKPQMRLGQTYYFAGQTEESIEVYKNCLERITDKEYPEEYAEIKLALGSDYLVLSQKENKEQNLQLAIDSYNEAQKIIDFDHYPIEYIQMNLNLGDIYLQRSEYLEPQINLEKAIDALKKSESGIKDVYENKNVPNHVRILTSEGLGYATLEEFNTKEPDFGISYLSPSRFILNEVNLGHVYHDLAILTNNKSYYNDSLDSLNKAFMAPTSFYDNSMSVSDKVDLAAYAFVQMNYAECVEGFTNQINAYNDSLLIITPQNSQEQFARIHKGIGISYFKEDPNNITNIETSIEHYKLALAYTNQNNQYEHAIILKNLGDSYGDLAFFKDKEENFAKAKNAYDKFLTIYNSDYPLFYAEVKRNNAILYTSLSDVKNNKTDYETAKDAFNIAKANGFFWQFPNYESYLNYVLP